MSARVPWTREQLLVALNIYQKLPFGQFDERNPIIKQVAAKMSRTPGSLAMKLSNLASLDPALLRRGRKGLSGASNLDRDVWEQFQREPQRLAPESEEEFRRLFAAETGDEVDVVKGAGVRIKRVMRSPPTGETTQPSTIMVRRGQQFFRQMILNAFDSRCCLTGLAVRELLVASHIKPWGAFPECRLDVQNGLCLTRLHDGAFDRGLITFDDNSALVLSAELRSHLPDSIIEENFVKFERRRITVPHGSLGPNLDFLKHHRENLFRG